MTFQKRNIIVPLASVLTVFAVILVLNCLTPLLADDYRYAFIFKDTQLNRVGSLRDVIISQYHHWLLWGGRNIAHSICQFFLMFDKTFFNVFNSLVYVAFTLLMYFHAAGIRAKFKPLLFAIINLLLWIFLPCWGQDILWLTGSCNYLWTSVFILAFLLPYRLSFLDNRSFGNRFAIIMFAAGVLAGWSNEHTAAAVMCVMILFFGFKLYRREKIHPWEIAGFVGFVIGFAVMIVAPGNYLRREEMVEGMDRKYSFIGYLFKRIRNCTYKIYLLKELYLLFPFLMIAFSEFIRSPRKLRGRYFFLTYVALSLLSCYAMVGTPQLPWRAEMPFVFFMVIGICGIINDIDWMKKPFLKKTAICLSIYFFAVYFPESVVRAVIDSCRVKAEWTARIDSFNRSKKAGVFDVKSPEIVSHNPHTGANRLYDGDSFTAGYYGLKSFESIERKDSGEQ